MKPSGIHNERGVALILTLTILAVVLILLMAFITSMRTERMIAKSYNDLSKSRMLAEGAVDQAVAAIANATPIPSTAKAWVAVPGAIISRNGGPSFTINQLYTPDTGVGIVDLNGTTLLITGTNSYYKTTAGAAITGGWQNVTYAGPFGSELIGRFAYWTDVEATKVNANTAKMRDPATLDASLPTDVDLRALEAPFYNAGTATIDAFWTAHSTPGGTPAQPWFSTVEEMRRGFSPVLNLDGFFSNQFFMTVNTVDTNTDAFGQARIDLTKITSESTPEYLAAYDRMTKDTWATVLYPQIVTDTTRDTLQKKYGEYGARQILANIIEYQNANEHSVPVGNATLVDGIPRDYSGLKKCPNITDVVVHVATNYVVNGTTGFNDLILHVFVDVRLINIYDADRGQNYQVLVDPDYIKYTPTAGTETDMTVSEQKKTLGLNVTNHTFRLVGAPSTSIANLGTHPPPEWTATIPGTAAPPAIPTVDNVRVKLKRVRLLHTADTDNTIVDWMSPADFDAAYPSAITFLPARFVPYLKPAALVTSPEFVSANPSAFFQPIGLEKLDPRTRTFSGSLSLANGGPAFTSNWRPLSDVIDTQNAPITWSSVNLGVTRDGNAPTLYRLLADVRFVEPGPFAGPGSGTVVPTQTWLGNYKEGAMASLGELAYIHTGYPFRTIRLRSIVPVTSGAAAATPYADGVASDGGIGDRNTGLGLQNVERDAIPDWIMLDFFTIGATPTYSGRININTRFLGAANSLAARSVPLQALINATSESNQVAYFAVPGIGTNVEIIAKNIAGRNLAANSPYVDSPAYFTPGEICEVKDLEFFKDVVSATAAYNDRPSKTRRQQLIRRISNLVTARSNTFTIWAIAQAIKKVDTTSLTTFDDTKGDLITGEVKVQAIVERYEEGAPPVVKFRTKYYRYIYE